MTAVACAAVLVALGACAAEGQSEKPQASPDEEATGQAVERADGAVVLPAPKLEGPMSLEKAIASRRSVRSFSGASLSAAQLSQLLWAGQGVTDPGSGKRAAPSAGALYPIEVFVADDDGVWQYVSRDHALQRLSTRDVRAELASAALGQSWIADAPAVFVIAAVVERTAGKYGDRASRYVTLEAGHVCQNMLLEATALGLASTPVGAFDDADVVRVAGLPADHQPLYVVPVGHPAP